MLQFFTYSIFTDIYFHKVLQIFKIEHQHIQLISAKDFAKFLIENKPLLPTVYSRTLAAWGQRGQSSLYPQLTGVAGARCALLITFICLSHFWVPGLSV